MHKISLLKIAEVVRQKKSPNARTTGSLLNCILSKVLSKYSFFYYCNTDTRFKVQRIRLVPDLRRFLAPLPVPSPRVSQKIQASLVVLAIQ